MKDFFAVVRVWYESHKRDLPWRHTSDAYRIWLSEIILQQTRVAQGYDYFLRFVEAYPTVSDLAAASTEEVLKHWQGLGYYSRARNLHAAAQQVMTEFGGVFPTRYADLIRLKGVGPYTAAAVASFSSGEAVAVVDGNVFRLLSRVFDLENPIDSIDGQGLFQAIALLLLPEDQSALHNQAMMELGALVCKPKSPGCTTCPLVFRCIAYANGTIDQRPVKQGKVKVRQRHLIYYIFKYKKYLYAHQRGEGDIWQGLWEFYLEENSTSSRGDKKKEQQNKKSRKQNSDKDIVQDSINNQPLVIGSLPQHIEKNPSWIVSPLLHKDHILTHQRLSVDFFLIETNRPPVLPAGYQALTWNEWEQKPVSRLISAANEKLLPLFRP